MILVTLNGAEGSIVVLSGRNALFATDLGSVTPLDSFRNHFTGG